MRTAKWFGGMRKKEHARKKRSKSTIGKGAKAIMGPMGAVPPRRNAAQVDVAVVAETSYKQWVEIQWTNLPVLKYFSDYAHRRGNLVAPFPVIFRGISFQAVSS